MQKDVARLKSLFAGVRDAIKARRYGQKGPEAPNVSASPRLMPLHPSALPESEGLKYKNEINTVFADPEIRNVAVSGPYGAGKSSVIAYVREQRAGETWVTISLAHFKGFDNGEEKPGRLSDAEIEAEILNQLVHRIDLGKSPKSRFGKIGDRSVLSESLVSAAVVLFVVLTATIWPTGIGNRLGGDSFLGWAEVVAWAILAFAGVFSVIRRGAISRFVKRLKFFNAEIELIGDSSSASPFDRCQADIVYLLNSAKVDAVVFEDLDRYGATPVFTKLRELNLVANDARGARKGTLRFFYLIKDSLFEDPKDRTKFFDFVIPVIPYVDPSNSLDIMKRGFAGIGMDVDKGFLYQLSAFIDDPRLLHELVNESAHYAEALFGKSGMGEGDPERIVAMLAYKSLFPLDYELLQVKRGYVFTVLGRKPVLANMLAMEAKTDLDLLKGKISAMGDSDDKAKSALQKKASKAEQSIDRFPTLTISELIAEADDADKLFVFGEEDLPRPADFKELRMGAILASPSFPMLRFLISGGWIDDSYERYMSNFYSESMSARDAAYLSSLRQAGAVDRDYIPDDPAEIVTRLDASTIARRGARNMHLFGALLRGADDVKLRAFMGSLARANEVSFFFEFVVSDLFVPRVFEEALRYMVFAIADAIEGDFRDEAKRLFAKRYLVFPPRGIADKKSLDIVLGFANGDELFLTADDKVDSRELCNALGRAGFRATAIDFDSCDEGIVRFVYDEGLYEPNATIVAGFMEEIHSVRGLLDSGDVLQHVFSLGGDPLKEKAEEEKGLLVSSVLNEVEGQLHDGPGCVVWVVNDDDVDIDLRREYIERLSSVEVVGLSEVAEPELRTLLMKRGLVALSAENIVGYFKDCGMKVNEELSSFVNRKGIPPTLTAELVGRHGVDEKSFLLALVRCREVDLGILKTLAAQYGCTLDAFGDPEVDDARVLALIESGSLSMNSASLRVLREHHGHLEADFALSDIDRYLDLVLPNEDGVSACSFSEGVALRLLGSEGLGIEEGLRLLSGFGGAVALSADYPDEVNIEIAQTHFDGNFEEAIEMCASASGDLRSSLVMLIVRNAAKVAGAGLVVPAKVLDEVLARESVGRASSLSMIASWVKGTNPSPSRNEIYDRVESASLKEYGRLLDGTQSMIAKTPEDDALLNLLKCRGMCGKIGDDVNSNNMRRVYPKRDKKK